MFSTKYPELFDYVVEEIKPYINDDNNKDDIYNLFIEIADKASLKYKLYYSQVHPCYEKAAAKLLSTDESVTDIAYSCGFNDLSYFIKVFRDFKGISPKQFRKKEIR